MPQFVFTKPPEPVTFYLPMREAGTKVINPDVIFFVKPTTGRRNHVRCVSRCPRLVVCEKARDLGPLRDSKTEAIISLGIQALECACRNEIDPSVLAQDRKSTRLNSSHDQISYAVFCLKKKKKLRT